MTKMQYKYTTQPAHVLMKETTYKDGSRATSFLGVIWDAEQAAKIALLLSQSDNGLPIN